MDEHNMDIDISGEDELPAGVQPGTLGGTDEPPPERTAADDLDADFDAALGGDLDVEAEEEGPTGPTGLPDPHPLPPPGMNGPGPPLDAPEVPPRQEAPAKPAPKKKTPKRTAKKKATKTTASTNSDGSTGSGSAARHYVIFQRHQIEVDGQITDGFVRVMFANPDDPQGAPLEALKARNRDMALHKAGKLFGHGFEGHLVATPVSMWEEKLVRNKPREEFKVQVGEVAEAVEASEAAE